MKCTKIIPYQCIDLIFFKHYNFITMLFKGNDFTMKRILSVFLALTCVFSCLSPSSIAFAVSETSSTEEIVPKGPRSSTSEEYMKKSSADARKTKNKNHIRYKAFLTALLCTTGTDVYIKFVQKKGKNIFNFTVPKIDNTNVKAPYTSQHITQINALILALKEKKDKIYLKTNVSKKYLSLQDSIEVNGHILTGDKVLEYGEKVLEFLEEKKIEDSKESSLETAENLTADVLFINKVQLLFQDILDFKENSPKTYLLERKTEEEIKRRKEINNRKAKIKYRIKKNINRKAFLTTLLCLSGSNIYIKYRPTVGYKTIDFTIYKINDKTINYNFNLYNEIDILIAALRNMKGNLGFKLKLIINGFKLKGIKINKTIIDIIQIDYFGDKIVEFLYEKAQAGDKEKIYDQILNISEDIEFQNKASEILNEILSTKPSEVTSPEQSGASSIESINTDYSTEKGQNYLAQKSFLTVLLCAIGINVDIVPKKDYKNEIRDFRISQINNTPFYSSFQMTKMHIEKLIEFFSENQTKISFEYKQANYLGKDEAMIINNKYLPINDVINLGKKAFDLIVKKCNDPLHTLGQSISLSKDFLFKEEVANLLKDIMPYDSSKKNKILPACPKFD